MNPTTLESLKTSIVNYLGAVLGFLFTMFIAPLVFTPDDNGLFKLILEVSLLLATYVQFGIPLVIKKYYYPIHLINKKEKGFDFLVFIVPLFIFGLFIGGFWIYGEILLGYLSRGSGSLYSYFIYLIFLVFCYLYLGIIEAYLSVLHKIVVINFIRNVILRVASILTAVVYYFTRDFESAIFCLTITTFLSTIFSFLYLYRHKKIGVTFSKQFIESKKQRRDLFQYMGYVVIANMGLFLIQKIDIILLGSLSSLTSVAYYATAYALIGILLIPYQSILNVSFPMIVKSFQLEKFDELFYLIKDNAIFASLLSVILYLIIGTNLDNIYSLMPNGDLYIVGKNVFLIIGLGRMVDISIGSIGQLLTVSKYYYLGLVVTLVISVFSVWINYYLISKYDFIGAAFGISLSAIFSSIIQCLIVYNLFKVHPFSNKNLVLLFISLPVLLVFLLPDILHPILMIFFKTALILGYYYFMLMKVSITPQLDQIIVSIKSKIKNKNE